MVEKLKQLVGKNQREQVLECDGSILCICPKCLDEATDLRYIKKLTRKTKK